MNGYERFLYWEGFRHGREWANACIFSKETLSKTEKQNAQNAEQHTMYDKSKTTRQKLERLISAANFMLDVLDVVPFRDAAGLRLHKQHPAYEKLQQTLDEVTK